MTRKPFADWELGKDRPHCGNGTFHGRSHWNAIDHLLRLKRPLRQVGQACASRDVKMASAAATISKTALALKVTW